MHRKRFIVLSLILTLVFRTNVYAEYQTSISNVRGASLIETVGGYELEIPEDSAEATFDVIVNGIPEGLNLAYRTSIGAGGTIDTVFPPRGAVRNGETCHIRVAVGPNNAAEPVFGEVLVAFEYENTNTEPPPRTLSIGIIRLGAVPAAEDTPVKEPVITPEEAEIISMLQNPETLPEITFSGNRATLAYNNPSLISWSSVDSNITLTINSVSALTADTAITVKGFRPTVDGRLSENVYDVVIPTEQINAVLSAKADEIAKTLISEMMFVEDSENSDANITRLVPAEEAILPAGALLTANGGYSFTEGTLALMTDTQQITEAIAAGESINVDVTVSFNGISANEYAGIVIPTATSFYFPNAAAYADTITPGEEAAAPPEFEISAEIYTESQSDAGDVTGGLRQTYDAETGGFLQHLTDTASFRTNVPNGIITNEPVLLSFPEGIAYEIYKDDELVTLNDGDYIRNDGCYRVIVRYEDAPESALNESRRDLSGLSLEEIIAITEEADEGAQEGLGEEGAAITNSAVYEGMFCFRIVTVRTGELRFYSPPKGYKITAVTYEGKKVDSFSQTCVHLPADGTYSFTVSKPHEKEYKTEIELYTVKPVIVLSGVLNGGQTTKNVTFEVLGENITETTVFLDDAQLYSYGEGLTLPGSYTLTARDIAGNTSAASFRILYSLNISGAMVFVSAVIVLGGIAGYMVWIRRHMRVR